jgi:hypothetical protein
MDNWYEILGVPENVQSAELKRLRDKALREHHPDKHVSEPADVQAWHAAQLKRVLEGVSFLLSETGAKILDAHLRATRAAAEAEKVRRRNAEDAQRRGDADDLRAQFGGRARPTSGAPWNGTPPPSRPSPHRPTPPRPPVKVRSPRSEADMVLPLDKFPPVDLGAVAGRVGALVASLVLLGSPFYIMSATGAASNDHLSGGALIELGCFALFVLGLIAVVCVLGNIFSRA